MKTIKPSDAILMKFENPQCHPCKIVEAYLQELAKKYSFTVIKVNTYTDEGVKLAQKHNVMTTPTVIFIKDGVVMHQLVGLAPKESYEALINRLI
ncbi:MAG: thioredoxin family protein [Eubacterium sp.]